jgi:hypothetical protein
MGQTIELIVVVNGQSTQVKANEEAPLLTVIEKALEQTGNTGQPSDNWELRNASGVELDIHKKVEDFHFESGTQLFLNLKAGVGG